jgi:hypothetical protein
MRDVAEEPRGRLRGFATGASAAESTSCESRGRTRERVRVDDRGVLALDPLAATVLDLSGEESSVQRVDDEIPVDLEFGGDLRDRLAGDARREHGADGLRLFRLDDEHVPLCAVACAGLSAVAERR